MPKKREKSETFTMRVERRKRLIEYYETVAKCNKKVTARHFTSTTDIPKRSIYRILLTHEKRKKAGYWKANIGAKRTLATPENLRKLEELYRMDPNMTGAEACQILNLKGHSSFRRLKAIYEQVKKGASITGETVIDYPNIWSANTAGAEGGDDLFDNENNDHFSDADPQGFSLHGDDEKKVLVNPNQKPKKLRKARTKRSQNTKRCLACFESFEFDRGNEADTSSKLQDNVNMVFVFKTLLGLSSEELISIMKISKGANPKDWAHFCEKCRVLVEEAAAIPRKIRELEERLAECKEELTENIKNSWSLKSRSVCVRESLNVTRRVRDIVKKRKRSKSPCRKVNSFEEGDRQAELLLPPVEESPVQAMVKQEVEVPDEPELELNSFLDMEESMDTSAVCQPKETETDVKSSVPPSSECIKSENQSLNEVNSLLNDTPIVSQNQTTSDATTPPVTIETSPIEVESIFDSTPLPTSTQGICDACGMEMRPMAIPSHKFNVHGVIMEGFTVKYCTKQGCDYKTLYDVHLRNHLKKHDLELNRPYCCSWCSMRFLRRKNLDSHEEIHKNAETRPYICDLCGSSFAVKTYLYLHKRLSHEKRYFPSTKHKRTSQGAPSNLNNPKNS